MKHHLDLVVDGVEHDLRQLCLAEGVGAAFVGALVVGAVVVDICLALRPLRLADHGILTVPAEQVAGEQLVPVAVPAAPHIPAHQLRHGFKVGAGDDGVVGVLHPHPVCLLLGARHPDFMVRRPPPPLDEYPGVDDVGEYPLDGHILPFRPLLRAEGRLEADALHPFVLHRRGDAAGVEPPGDLQDGETVLIHPEDQGNDIGCRLIHQQAVLILRGFPIPEGDEAAHILALLALDLQAGAYLDGDVAAVDVIYQVFERKGDDIGTASGRHAVVVVVDGDIADAHRREYLLQVVPGVDIVP